MKTPESRPRFQTSTRHYHRHREESSRDWEDWIDGERKPGRSRRGWWIAAAISLAATAGVLIFAFDLV
jgi:hypothetical protein